MHLSLCIRLSRSHGVVGFTHPAAPVASDGNTSHEKLLVRSLAPFVGMLPTPLIQLRLHAEYPGVIALKIRVHGSLLRLLKGIDFLLPFAMYTAFPCPDYYGSSALSSIHHRSPQFARLRHGRMLESSHVPALNLWTRRWHALPLAARDAGQGRLPSIEENKPSTPDQNFQPAEIGPHGLPVPSNRWEVSCKYRGFWRMLRCLTLDPVVAQPAVDGRPPVQLRSLCLFNPAVGTRQRFTIPFHCDPSSREVALQPPVKSQPASPRAMLSWRTEIPGPYRVAMCRLGRQPGRYTPTWDFLRLWPDFKPFPPTDMLHLLTTYHPAFSTQEHTDATIAITWMRPGQGHNALMKLLLVGGRRPGKVVIS